MFKFIVSKIEKIYTRELYHNYKSTKQKATDISLHILTGRETDKQVLARIDREHEEKMKEIMGDKYIAI